MYRFNGNFPDDFKDILTDLHYSLRCDRKYLTAVTSKSCRSVSSGEEKAKITLSKKVSANT